MAKKNNKSTESRTQKKSIKNNVVDSLNHFDQHTDSFGFEEEIAVKSGMVRILTAEGCVPFQGVPLPVTITNRSMEIEFANAMNLETPIYLVPLKKEKILPSKENMSPFGVEMKVMRIIDLPDGNKNAFLVGGERKKVFPSAQLGENVFIGEVENAPDYLRDKESVTFDLIMEMVVEAYDYTKGYFSEMAHVQMAPPRELQEDNKTYLNFIIVTSPLDYEERLDLFEETDLCNRAKKTLLYLDKIRKQIELRKEIFSKSSMEMEREQRDHFLRSQIRQIQNEIGEGEEADSYILEEKAAAKDLPDEAKRTFEKELRKLKRFNPNSPDYAIQYTYLDTILNLPWNILEQSEIDLKKLQEDLEKDHFGLEKIKERILEHIAVLKLRGDMRSPILCLYGPPGVGKTSLCRSIADSLGKEYARISLGGLHDESQLRGHRRTYIGAMPGRIISSLSKMKSNNPVFVLDEIDKIGHDHRGDPAQALLEILDPEQNSHFHDNYLDMEYDLSKIFFICTANDISSISAPLRDRMELIEVSGYILEEKVEIAKRHLVPKLLENHGFKKKELTFETDAIEAMIENYTRESGVRGLEKTISRLLRKIAMKKAQNLKFRKKITKKEVLNLLGREDLVREPYIRNLPVGVVAGLAWTPVGGEILYFESSISKGKGNLTLTGNLGDVMKESATLALQWVKANSEKLNIEPDRFSTTDVHLHVPEGAVPKDGPSAGITMVCSLVSSFKGIPCKEDLAMTGEITLRGSVLPVGGIKEKMLAAKRAGIKNIILSEKNRRDVEDIEPKYFEGLNFIYVENIMEVISEALDIYGLNLKSN